jgi:hypothetical protein
LFQRLMTHLALAAMLLLALVPTTGRLLSAQQADPTPDAGTWLEMCTASGLKLVKVAALFAGESAVLARTAVAASGAPGSDMGLGMFGGEDCDYCPLLQATLASAMVLLLVAALAHRREQAGAPHMLALRSVARLGLGPRGPPLEL